MVRSLLWGALVGAVSMGLFFALNYASLGRGGADKLAAAYKTGALDDEDLLKGDTVRGHHQFQDCLVLSMTVDQRYSVKELTVSPTWMKRSPNYCIVIGGAQYPLADRMFYHNYIHGSTTLARFLLPVLTVEKIRDLYRLAITLALVTGIGIAMLRLAKGEGNPIFLIVLLVLARGFGLETFGMNLGHAPSDFVLIGYVVYLSTTSLSRRAAIVSGAVFGALTAVFEFMTGGIPLGLAVIIGLTWFALRDREVRTVLQSAAAFLSAAVTCFAIKFATVWAVFGTPAILKVAGRLAERSMGDAPALTTPHTSLLPSILYGMDSAMMPGLGVMAVLLVLLAMGFGIWGLLRSPTIENRLIAASSLPIVLWIAVFQQHTIVHAWFMDRMFVWPVAAGFTLFVRGLRARDTSQATSEVPCYQTYETDKVAVTVDAPGAEA